MQFEDSIIDSFNLKELQYNLNNMANHTTQLVDWGKRHQMTNVLGPLDLKQQSEDKGSSSFLTMEARLNSLMQSEAEKIEISGRRSSKPRVQKVPFMLRNKENIEKYYEPRLLSIGPIHHENHKLKPAETIKRNLARDFIIKSSEGGKVLCRKIEKKIDEIKQCFMPDIIKGYADEELSWMLFVDGCTVLNCIRYIMDEELDDSIIKIQHLAFAEQDLLLLENQIPFLVLDLLMGDENNNKEWDEMIENFIRRNIMVLKPKQNLPKKETRPIHLLELLRDTLLYISMIQDQKFHPEVIQKIPNKSSLNILGERLVKLRKAIAFFWEKKLCRRNEDKRSFRNVKELKEAGIYFKRSETSHFTDISFHSLCFLGILNLPPIRVDDSTSPKLMNLIAYEMCPDFSNDFGVTSYVCFLDSLIDRPEDAMELRKARILENYLGSDEDVAKIFNEITTDLVPDPKVYQNVRELMQRHCNIKWRTWLAQAYHEHFSSPWTFLAFAAAVIALALSGIQTKYTISSPPGPCDDFCMRL